MKNTARAATPGGAIARRRLSISARLTLWYSLSLLILLSLFVIFLYASIHLGLHRDFNDQLNSELERLVADVQVDGEAPSFTDPHRLRVVGDQSNGAQSTFIRLLSTSGDVLESTPNFNDVDGFTPRLPLDGSSDIVTHRWEGAPARTVYRAISALDAEPAAWLEITRFESALHRDLHRLEWLMVVGVLAGLIVATVSGYVLARRALRPVAALTHAAQRIRPTDLGARLPEAPGVRDELTALAETFNGLLARLHASFERERRFREDAAHEMFTPISAVQSEVEVALRRPRKPDEYQRVLSRIREHSLNLSRRLDGLLELSRAEAAASKSGAAADLSDVTRRRLDEAVARAVSEGVALEYEIGAEVQVAAEVDDVRTIVDNLIDNAMKYTFSGGTIDVCVAASSGEGVLTVHDTGVGFSAADYPRLFDRFFRAEQDTIRGTRGSGLGLSIVRTLAEASGGSVEARSAGPGQGSTFIVRLPLRSDAKPR